MSNYRIPRRKDWLTVLIYIVIYLMVIGFTSFYLLLSYWYVWVALVMGGLLLLVSTRKGYYVPLLKMWSHIRNISIHRFLQPAWRNQGGGLEVFELSKLFNPIKNEGIHQNNREELIKLIDRTNDQFPKLRTLIVAIICGIGVSLVTGFFENMPDASIIGARYYGFPHTGVYRWFSLPRKIPLC